MALQGQMEGIRRIALCGKYGEGKYVLVDEADYEHVMKISKWYYHNQRGYAWGYIAGEKKNIDMHKWIFGHQRGHFVDHISRDKLDNRRCNLRFLTPQENTVNSSMRKTNKSGFKGVCKEKKTDKWRAEIQNKGIRFCLGCFNTKEEAAAAYNIKAIELFGHLAVLNDVDPEIKPQRLLYSLNKSGYRGVSQTVTGKWEGCFAYKKQRWRKICDSKEEAAQFYNAKATEILGEKAVLNDI